MPVLFDADQGLYLDGARLNAAGEVMVESTIYTYNQGPVLGALLELGGEANLARAATVVEAVDQHLTSPSRAGAAPGQRRSSAATERATADSSPGSSAVTWHSPPPTPGFPEAVRATAARLVLAPRTPSGPAGAPCTTPSHWRGTRGTVFSSIHAKQPAADTYPPGAAVELSTQLQAWMVLEAAAAVHQQPPGN